MFKKILSVLLIVILAISSLTVFPVAYSAEEVETPEEIVAQDTDEELTEPMLDEGTIVPEIKEEKPSNDLAPVGANNDLSATGIPSESQFANSISSLQGTFVNGQYWNKYSSSDYSRTGNIPCNGISHSSAHYGMSCSAVGYCDYCTCECGYFAGAWQCMGFAYKMASLSLGSYPGQSGWEKSYSLGDVYAGDVIRIRNDAHSIFVYKVDGNTIYYADCNWTGPCRVRWGGTYSYWDLSSICTYKWHLSGNYLSGKGENPPSGAWISASSSQITAGGSISFTFGANNAAGYTIGIDRNGSRIITEDSWSGKSYTFNEGGDYSAYVTAYNSAGSVDSNRVYFTVIAYAKMDVNFWVDGKEQIDIDGIGTIQVYVDGQLQKSGGKSSYTDFYQDVIVGKPYEIKVNFSNNNYHLGGADTSDGSGITGTTGSGGTRVRLAIVKDSGGVTTIPNGDYIIAAGGTNTYCALGITSNNYPALNNDNINLRVESNSPETQYKFTFTYLNNGYYSIKQTGTNMALDVANASKSRQGNVQMYTYNGSDAQQWKICSSDNYFTIQAKCSGMYLTADKGDFSVQSVGGSPLEPSCKNVYQALQDTDKPKSQVWGIYNNDDNEKPVISEIKSVISNSDEFTVTFKATDNHAIKNTSMTIYTQKTTDGKRYTPQYIGSDTYSVTAKRSELPQTNNSIYKLLIFAHDYTEKYTGESGTVDFRIKSDTKQSVPSGYYRIVSSLDENKALNVENSSKEIGADIQIWGNLDDSKQIFTLNYVGNGFYEITNTNSNYEIESEDDKYVTSNVIQNKTNNKNTNQNWMIKPTGDGYYVIVCRANGLALNVKGSNTSNGTTVQADTLKQPYAANQKWILRRVITDSSIKVLADLVDESSTTEIPTVTVLMHDNPLTEGKDYTIVSSYDPSKKTLTATITGINDYCDTVTKTVTATVPKVTIHDYYGNSYTAKQGEIITYYANMTTTRQINHLTGTIGFDQEVLELIQTDDMAYRFPSFDYGNLYQSGSNQYDYNVFSNQPKTLNDNTIIKLQFRVIAERGETWLGNNFRDPEFNWDNMGKTYEIYSPILTNQDLYVPTKPLLGDADGNDDVDIVDATIIQRNECNMTVPYPIEVLMNGDVDGDGELTVLDATFIQRFCSSMKTPYKIGEPIA